MEEQILKKVVGAVEKTVDKEIERLDEVLDDDEQLKRLRRKRMEELRKLAEEKGRWSIEGHGKIHRISTTDEFFDSVKRSKRVVAFFYKEGSQYCEVLDKHLRILIPKHMETKFIYVDAERAKPVSTYLKIWMLPTMVLVKDQVTNHSVVGLDELDNYGSGNFKTSDLEKLLIKHGVLKNLNE